MTALETEPATIEDVVVTASEVDSEIDERPQTWRDVVRGLAPPTISLLVHTLIFMLLAMIFIYQTETKKTYPIKAGWTEMNQQATGQKQSPLRTY